MQIDKILAGADDIKEAADKIALAIHGLSAAQGGAVGFENYEHIKRIIRDNLHRQAFIVGEQIETQRETAITISKGDSTGITGATLDEETFLNAVGEVKEGIFEANFDGFVWHKEDGSNILLADYGITVTGTPVEGDHIIVQETASTLTWDILDHDRHELQNEHLTHSVVIGMHNCFNYGVIPFKPSQLTYYAPNGLSAGKYKFTLYKGAYGGGTNQDGTYVFTLTQPIPVGGGWRHTTVGVYQSAYTKQQIIDGKINTYNVNPQRVAIESNIVVHEYDASTDTDAVDLGTFSARDKAYLTDTNNVTERSAYGSSRWRDSIERMWLNSMAKAVKSGDTTFSYWYEAKTNFDLPPSESVRKMAGFLHGFDKGLLDLIQPVAVKTALNDSDKAQVGDYDITYDRIWLQSMTELGLGANNSVNEGATFEYWRTRTTNDDRIKYEGSTARYWWLRSPNPSYAGSVRPITPSGELDYNLANNSVGVVPACVLG